MRPALSILLFMLGLGSVPAQAGVKEDFLATVKKLEDAYFDELPREQRDDMFRQLGVWDDPKAAAPIASIAALYGAHLSSLRAQMKALQSRFDQFRGRAALTAQEEGLRNSLLRKVEAKERAWALAQRSEDLLIHAVAGMKNTKTIDTMVRTFGRHGSAAVRVVLARACAKWHLLLSDNKRATKFFRILSKMAHDKETRVRIAVAQSMASFETKDGYEMLRYSLKDGDWRVRLAAIRSLAKIRNNIAVTLLIEAMQREKGRLQADINTILEQITGEVLVYPEVWDRWWQSVGKIIPPKRPPAKDKTDNEKLKKDAARFYGIPTESRRICFIIDMSGSMNKEVEQFKDKGVVTGPTRKKNTPTEGKTRWEVARNELLRAVSNLNPEKQFTIIFFNQAAKPWRPQLTPAVPKTKKELRADVKLITPSGTTYTLGALREAFIMAGSASTKGATKKDGNGIDTIFVLSDGGPTDGTTGKPMEPDPILEQVREWNKDKSVVIHAIAVDTEEVGTYFLKQLAGQNGGVFVERK